MLDGPAAPLPEGELAELLADALRLVGRLPDEPRLEERERGLDEREAGEAAAEAGEPLVGVDLDEGVHLLVGVGAAGPAGVVGRPPEGDRADAGDLHRAPLRGVAPLGGSIASLALVP